MNSVLRDFIKNGVWHALQTIQKFGIGHADGRIAFGQIYGMGEQLSIPLGKIRIR